MVMLPFLDKEWAYCGPATQKEIQKRRLYISWKKSIAVVLHLEYKGSCNDTRKLNLHGSDLWERGNRVKKWLFTLYRKISFILAYS